MTSQEDKQIQGKQMNNLEMFLHFVKERHSIYTKRQLGLPAPWTTDPVLDSRSFCNVRRELDATTVWVKNNIRDKYHNHPNIIGLLVFSRMINDGKVLEEILMPYIEDEGVDWDSVKTSILTRLDRGDKIERGAYRTSAAAFRKHTTKFHGQIDVSIIPMCNNNETIITDLQNANNDVTKLVDAISGYKSIGTGFFCNQILIDISYMHIFPDTWYRYNGTLLGPGSAAGLNIVFPHSEFYNKGGSYNYPGWRVKMKTLQGVVGMVDGELLSMHDIQNCLCDFQKYHSMTVTGKMRGRIYKGDSNDRD